MSRRSPDSVSGALALGLVCSGVGALPAFLRVLPASPLAAALALWAAVSISVVPLGLWLRRALAAGLPATDRALLAGTALSALPLALFGGVLKSTTHHRPLGGVTFAVAALAALAFSIGLSLRVFRNSSQVAGRGRVQSAWQTLYTAACALSLASVVALGLARAARPSLMDFAALLVAASATARAPIPAWLERLKLPVTLTGWVVLVGCALAALRVPHLAALLDTQAPVAFATLSWLGAGS